MNSQLIPTVSGQLDGQTQALVDARELHDFLGVETQFKDWIKRRIADYGFVENVDFSCCSNLSSGENQRLRGFFGGHNRIDYLISLDMAKELCMVERNDKGRQARRYFIEMEKQAKAIPDAVLWRIDALEDAYFQAAPEMLSLLRYRNMGLNLTEIGKLLDLNPGAVSYRLKKLNDLGFVQYQANPQIGRYAQQSLSLEG
ncbi:antA/AntB antirepressor family protein [Bergeriella denitrificans]|uniref:Phage anti-repressor protein n=2 Tax=Bergeriella denitrificans TaxID=494 RepID=A0A378UGG5_BERDE|nr:antA/AntB antirepressor family protein [Bergeriella denitrificans]STZ75542.1 phage anti-repressor protein [Bergeriella denitrificans]